MFKTFALFFICLFVFVSGFSQIKCGSESTLQYLPLLKNKRVALVVNPTSQVKQTHLLDTLLSLKIKVVKIFAPEHGFRGMADAGTHINNGIDAKSGLPIVSLYGKNYKPKRSDLERVDVVLFDIQDVGVRFYTYLSTLNYVMEACAENKIPLIVLDRPNPNGMYVDGPVLDLAKRSFVGIHPIPLVHGMTLGELALMINNEGWLKNKEKCTLTVIPCLQYAHSVNYTLPIKPSPNLPDSVAIRLYPSLGLFEGTVVSVGRGTDFPFKVFGYPGFRAGNIEFIPRSVTGAGNPPYKHEHCQAIDLSHDTSSFTLKFLIEAYTYYPKKDSFFNSFFDNLAGNTVLRKQIEDGLSEDSIRRTWQPELDAFREKRKKYLLYP